MIKKLFALIIFIGIFVFTTTDNAVAQKTTSGMRYSKAISGDLLSFLSWGWLYGTYEHQLNPENSLTISVGYFNRWGLTAFGVGGSYRWYLKVFDDGKHPIEGFCLGPAAGINFFSWDNSSINSKTSFYIGGEVAYKWIFNGFVVEPNLLIQIPLGDFNTYDASYGGVRIGYGW